MFLGGDEVVRAAAAPVVDALASTVVVVGERAGDGQAMKTVNQLLCGVHVAAAAEALALADALGLDPAVCVDVLGAGAAASFMLAHRGPRIVAALAGAEPEVMSRLDIFVKDLGLVEEAARSAGLATPVAAAAEQLFRLADSAGFGTKDDSVLARLLRPRERQEESKRLKSPCGSRGDTPGSRRSLAHAALLPRAGCSGRRVLGARNRIGRHGADLVECVIRICAVCAMCRIRRSAARSASRSIAASTSAACSAATS